MELTCSSGNEGKAKRQGIKAHGNDMCYTVYNNARDVYGGRRR